MSIRVWTSSRFPYSEDRIRELASEAFEHLDCIVTSGAGGQYYVVLVSSGGDEQDLCARFRDRLSSFEAECRKRGDVQDVRVQKRRLIVVPRRVVPSITPDEVRRPTYVRRGPLPRTSVIEI